MNEEKKVEHELKLRVKKILKEYKQLKTQIAKTKASNQDEANKLNGVKLKCIALEMEYNVIMLARKYGYFYYKADEIVEGIGKDTTINSVLEVYQYTGVTEENLKEILTERKKVVIKILKALEEDHYINASGPLMRNYKEYLVIGAVLSLLEQGLISKDTIEIQDGIINLGEIGSRKLLSIDSKKEASF